VANSAETIALGTKKHNAPMIKKKIKGVPNRAMAGKFRILSTDVTVIIAMLKAPIVCLEVEVIRPALYQNKLQIFHPA
jgi:hypothetical protein